MTQERTRWLAEHAELMNRFGPYSEEAVQYTEDPYRRNDNEFLELALTAARLKEALQIRERMKG
jgi:hypothetical protein